jgi:hypothetical protein
MYELCEFAGILYVHKIIMEIAIAAQLARIIAKWVKLKKKERILRYFAPL